MRTFEDRAQVPDGDVSLAHVLAQANLEKHHGRTLAEIIIIVPSANYLFWPVVVAECYVCVLKGALYCVRGDRRY